jgi:hypothetical protein
MGLNGMMNKLYLPLLLSKNGRIESQYIFQTEKEAEMYGERMRYAINALNYEPNAFHIVETKILVRGGEAVPEIIKEKDKLLN